MFRMAFTFHYVSISTSTTLGINTEKIDLHSTMYLFQLSDILCSGLVNSIYIPLCIYFNTRRVVMHTRIIIIYIPLCIYFNYLDCARKSNYRKFTFHYVSISTDMGRYKHFTKYDIYIPLCIYFNCFPSQATGACKYLHSTMYLFQLEFFVSEFKTASIYIPLCIYFN